MQASPKKATNLLESPETLVRTKTLQDQQTPAIFQESN